MKNHNKYTKRDQKEKKTDCFIRHGWLAHVFGIFSSLGYGDGDDVLVVYLVYELRTMYCVVE